MIDDNKEHVPVVEKEPRKERDGKSIDGRAERSWEARSWRDWHFTHQESARSNSRGTRASCSSQLHSGSL